ncbi:MAG TPA: hypothetical protein VF183_07390 [Acidimicrobiales bacterium]
MTAAEFLANHAEGWTWERIDDRGGRVKIGWSITHGAFVDQVDVAIGRKSTKIWVQIDRAAAALLATVWRKREGNWKTFAPWAFYDFNRAYLEGPHPTVVIRRDYQKTPLSFANLPRLVAEFHAKVRANVQENIRDRA